MPSRPRRRCRSSTTGPIWDRTISRWPTRSCLASGARTPYTERRSRMAIRVFHCDDSEAFTRLVAFWLAEQEDIEHAGAAHSAQGALDALPQADPDVVLLDTLGRPGDDSLLTAVRAAAPEAKVIVYSGYVRL